MKLEPANIACPKCGSPNYMRHLIGKGVGKLDMKCINCNSYFNFDELYKKKIAKVLKPKPQTNADRIRSMTDKELAKTLCAMTNEGCPPWHDADISLCHNHGVCHDGECWLKWLKQEATE